MRVIHQTSSVIDTTTTSPLSKKKKFSPVSSDFLSTIFNFSESSPSRLFPNRDLFGSPPSSPSHSSPSSSSSNSSSPNLASSFDGDAFFFLNDPEEQKDLIEFQKKENNTPNKIETTKKIIEKLSFDIDDLPAEDIEDCYFECYEYSSMINMDNEAREQESLFYESFEKENGELFDKAEEWEEGKLYLKQTLSSKKNWVRKSRKNKKQKQNKSRYVSAFSLYKAERRRNHMNVKESRPFEPFGFHRGPYQSQPTSRTNQNNNRAGLTPQERSKIEREEMDRAIQQSLASFTSLNGREQQLISLQNRDITPEDYDLLLLLDSTVKKKTVDKKTLNKFTERVLEANDPVFTNSSSEMCSICMSEYVVGEKVKVLPCSHFFHSECIQQWLSGSSVNCPLDGIAVAQ